MVDQVFADTASTGRLIVYAGRFFDQVSAIYLPVEYSVLSDWDVPSTRLHAAVGEANPLVILDPFSFPFEAMTGELERVPLVVALPPGFDADFLDAVFEAPAFARLGFFDRIATRDDALWEELRRRHGWIPAQRLEISGSRPEEVAEEAIRALLETSSASPAPLGGRGDGALSGSPGRRVSRGLRGDSRLDKAVHLAQAAVLEPQLVAPGGGDVEDVALEVLEIGTATGRWAASFDLTRTRFVGLDASEEMVEAARSNFPDGRFECIGEDLMLPYADESYDLAFCVDVMQRNPAPAKRLLLSEMWRVTRPGGRLVFLEDFVASERSTGGVDYTMSVLAFVELLLEATSGQVVLEHVESLQYPKEDYVRGGLLAVSRLGVPKTW